MRTIKAVLGVILVPACLMLPAQSRPAQAQGIPNDWSHHHVVFSMPSSPEALERLEQEPRYQMQQAWRERQAVLGDSAAVFDSEARQIMNTRDSLKRDWSASLGSTSATVGNEMYPAKFSFGIDTANCASAPIPDYVAFNTSVEGTASHASIIAFDNLYGGGLCTGTVPSVYWSYNTGRITTSMVLSNDGSQLAFINTPGNGAASLDVLKWKTGQGTSATAPVSPDTVTANPGTYVTCRGGNTSCLLHLTFASGNNDSFSAPFYNYANDTLYVGDNAGRLHKFTGVFNGTPGEVTTGGWPVVVGTRNSTLASPVFDSGSNNIFFGDSLGDIKYVKETGSVTGVCSSSSHGGAIPCLGTTNGTAGGPIAIILGGRIFDGPLVDTTSGRVFFFNGQADAASNVCDVSFGSTSRCFGIVEQTNTQLGNPVRANVGGSNDFGNVLTNIHAGAFDNNYLNGNPASGFLYVCGKNRNAGFNQPALSRIGFNASGVMNTTTSADLSLITPFAHAECSPVTEIDNGTTDRMFASVFANGDLRGACSGSCTGACLYSFDVTSSFPTTCSARLPATGGTSGLIIDNTLSAPGASQVYFTPLSGGRAVQASQAGLN
jgi:hypothetical protein